MTAADVEAHRPIEGEFGGRSPWCPLAVTMIDPVWRSAGE